MTIYYLHQFAKWVLFWPRFAKWVHGLEMGFNFGGSLAVYFFVGVVILVFESGSYFVMGIMLGNISRAICLFKII